MRPPRNRTAEWAARTRLRRRILQSTRPAANSRFRRHTQPRPRRPTSRRSGAPGRRIGSRRRDGPRRTRRISRRSSIPGSTRRGRYRPVLHRTLFPEAPVPRGTPRRHTRTRDTDRDPRDTRIQRQADLRRFGRGCSKRAMMTTKPREKRSTRATTTMLSMMTMRSTTTARRRWRMTSSRFRKRPHRHTPARHTERRKIHPVRT